MRELFIVIDLSDWLPTADRLFSTVSYLGVDLDEIVGSIFTGMNNYCEVEDIMLIVKDYLLPVYEVDEKHYVNLETLMLNFVLKVKIYFIDDDLPLPITKWGFDRDCLRLALGEFTDDPPDQISGYSRI